MSAYTDLSAEQKSVLRAIVSYGQSHGYSAKDIEAGVETGIVEQSLHNLPYGDGTSVGWRQETSSSYGAAVAPRLNLSQTIPAFYSELGRVNQGLSPGQLAQAVQRSAYPGRYEERKGLADQLIAAVTGKAAGPAFTSSTTGPVTGATTPSSSSSGESFGQKLEGLGIKASLFLGLIIGGVALLWYGGKTGLQPAKAAQA